MIFQSHIDRYEEKKTNQGRRQKKFKRMDRRIIGAPKRYSLGGFYYYPGGKK